MLENVDINQTAHKRSAPEAASSVSGDNFQAEVINKKALSIINRVRDKLTGRDFSQGDPIDVPTQVDLLIKQATSHENLCQCYIGWCPFWWKVLGSDECAVVFPPVNTVLCMSPVIY